MKLRSKLIYRINTSIPEKSRHAEMQLSQQKPTIQREEANFRAYQKMLMQTPPPADQPRKMTLNQQDLYEEMNEERYFPRVQLNKNKPP
jgi:hypothetical protein